MSENPYEPSTLYEAAPARSKRQNASSRSGWKWPLAQIAVGFVMSMALWRYTAPREAWDVNGFYSASVFAIGAMASLGRWSGVVWGNIGVFAGQYLGLLSLQPLANVNLLLAAVGIVFFGTVPSLLGSAGGGLIGWLASRWWPALRSP